MRRTVLCSATRLSREDFWRNSLLGRSLLAFPPELRPELALVFDNTGPDAKGLPAIYNAAIAQCPDEMNLLLVHDDVYLHDTFLQYRISDGLKRYAVIGLAGSAGSDPTQPSWGLAFDEELNSLGWQKTETITMSGAVSHCSSMKIALHTPSVQLSQYGNLPLGCDLLDGLFLAVKPIRLRHAGVKFDEQFAFHLYDLDFCRSARAAGLSLGTWPILVTHGSGGNFSTPAWKDAARKYLAKWRSTPHGRSPSTSAASSARASPTLAPAP